VPPISEVPRYKFQVTRNGTARRLMVGIREVKRLNVQNIAKIEYVAVITTRF
jgi:hypothetical protein